MIKMKLENLLDKIMGTTIPCEINIPCPFYEPENENNYCSVNDCAKGMEILIKTIIKNKEE